MKLKKIPFYLLLFLLTFGASLIIGFLSFGGMLAITPLLPIAIGSLILSVAYEGEIYFQNIKGALNKLFFKPLYVKHQLANQFLLKHFPKTTNNEDCPVFFKEYEAQLTFLHTFEHKRRDKESQIHRKNTRKILKDMEKWFAQQLFMKVDEEAQKLLPEYQRKIYSWLADKQQKETIDLLTSRTQLFMYMKAFSALAGFFMGWGTTYLLFGEFAAIPLLATIPLTLLPGIIASMAIIAGTAYGLLTYNAITDMIANDTLRQWYNKPKSLLMKVFAVTLVISAVALTLCTAGTWWTVANEVSPLFTWMSKVPRFFMGIVNPIITGISALIFNVQNTSETFDLIEEMKVDFWKKLKKSFNKTYEKLAQENLLQLVNPFRVILAIAITPLRILLFLGHLVSIGVTSDRVPGISQFFSAFICIVIEGGEDLHYFVPHAHKHNLKGLLKERLNSSHGHDHSADLPTRLLKLVFAPIYIAATSWAWASSQINVFSAGKVLSLADAWEQQIGLEETSKMDKDAPSTSIDWKNQHAIYRIERFKEKHLNPTIINASIAKVKAEKLTELQDKLRSPEKLLTLNEHIEEAAQDKHFNQHRFFFSAGKTRTETFLEQLPGRIHSL